MGTLGENLKAARVAAKLTQEELAEKIGTTKSAISRYELGKREPSIAQLTEIARILRVSLETLAGIKTFDDGESFDKEWERLALQAKGEQVTVIHKEGGEIQIIDQQKEQLLSTYEKLDSEDRHSLVRHGELLAGQLKYRDTAQAGEE